MGYRRRSAMILTGMIFAAIYVLVLVGLTRSTYFMRGPLFDRELPPDVAALYGPMRGHEGGRACGSSGVDAQSSDCEIGPLVGLGSD